MSCTVSSPTPKTSHNLQIPPRFGGLSTNEDTTINSERVTTSFDFLLSRSRTVSQAPLFVCSGEVSQEMFALLTDSVLVSLLSSHKDLSSVPIGTISFSCKYFSKTDSEMYGQSWSVTFLSTPPNMFVNFLSPFRSHMLASPARY